MHIFDEYTPAQLREIYLEPRCDWPEDFDAWIQDEIAARLLHKYMKTVKYDEFMEEARDIIEEWTYGYEDADGEEMLDFIPENQDNSQTEFDFKYD